MVATDSFSRERQGANALVIVGFLHRGWSHKSGALARWRARRLATRLALVVVGSQALASDVVERSEERVRHDLLVVLVACGALAAVTTLRARIRHASAQRLLVSSVLLVGGSP